MARLLDEIRSDGHAPTFTRRQAGYTALRPRRPVYANNVKCQCGWEFQGQARSTQRDAEREHNAHLREVG